MDTILKTGHLGFKKLVNTLQKLLPTVFQNTIPAKKIYIINTSLNIKSKFLIFNDRFLNDV